MIEISKREFFPPPVNQFSRKLAARRRFQGFADSQIPVGIKGRRSMVIFDRVENRFPRALFF